MAHVHYADYSDSHWYSGSPTDGAGIWIRDPVIDGVTKLDDAMELLDQARKEIHAVESALGTGLKGSDGSLAERLSHRVSPEGLQRGLVRPLRGANTSSASKNEINRWWDWGSNYVQFGITAATSGVNTVTGTWAKSYFSGLPPRVVVAKFVTTNERLGAAQIRVTQITETDFKAVVRAFSSSGSWTTPDFNFRVLYMAYGGFPSS